MPIIQVNGDNSLVSVLGNTLIVEAFEMSGVSIPRLEQDLTAFQTHEPRTMRLYAGLDGEYHYKDVDNMYWQIAEGVLPPLRYNNVDTGEVDENEQPIMEMVLAVPDLANEMDIKVWALPAPGGGA